MAVEQIGARSVDGVTIGGATTDKISLYGVTPVVQASAITAPATTLSVSSGHYGFGSTQANAITTAISAIVTALKNAGITA